MNDHIYSYIFNPPGTHNKWTERHCTNIHPAEADKALYGIANEEHENTLCRGQASDRGPLGSRGELKRITQAE
jgi:hypothetical protein